MSSVKVLVGLASPVTPDSEAVPACCRQGSQVQATDLALAYCRGRRQTWQAAGQRAGCLGAEAPWAAFREAGAPVGARQAAGPCLRAVAVRVV